MENQREAGIDGVKIKPLNRHCDERGYLLEVLRDDDDLLERFGQTTYTVTYPGVIKAFHWHRKQSDLWYVAQGEAQVVLYDLRSESPTYRRTQVIYAGEHEPILIVIPPGVAHGYSVLGDRPVSLFYHTTRSYNPADPDEERIAFDDPAIGFDW
ncbi:MAG: dTDP-4-dehydrorhamnose 3,5-epimerase family protein [Actinomycetota bacterium]|nr:dTDP-4-dehydrorhamnose 3,5-epimerase family protein [Actinomycetota bacterium]